MVKNVIIEKVANIHGGCFTRVRYKSELPLKALYKKAGYTVTKFTETNCRIGVDYNHIGSVINRKATEEQSRRNYTNNYVWIIPNRIAYNEKTKEYYLQMATSPSPYSKSHYVISTPDGKKIVSDTLTDEIKEYVIDSYFNKSGFSEVRKIKLDNIISVNEVMAYGI